MKTSVTMAVGAVTCAVLFVAPVCAASNMPAKAEQKTGTASKILGRPETLSGKILTVEPAKRLMVVEDSHGVPFDMVVTPSTRIKAGDHTVQLKDLTTDSNKPVSVKFIPERSGDVAQSIEVTG